MSANIIVQSVILKIYHTNFSHIKDFQQKLIENELKEILRKNLIKRDNFSLLTNSVERLYVINVTPVI